MIGAPAAMGASLGGLAMLHAQRRFPRAFGALFLQSGCFFMPRYDAHERRFSRYARIMRFVRDTLRDGEYAIPVPVTHHRRPRGGERAQQSRDGACPGRTGVRGVPGGGTGHAQLRRLAGCLRPAPDHAAQARLDTMNARPPRALLARDRHRRHGRRLRPLRPPACWPSRPRAGKAYDWRDNGMIGARRDLIDAGRVKIYCVDSFDAASWSNQSLPLEERAPPARPLRVVDPRPGRAVHPARHRRRDHHHRARASAPSTPRTSRSSARTCSRSRSACRATTTRRPGTRWGERGDATYFNNPIDYVGQLGGDHLEWLRSRLSLLLVCGQGQWEDTTGSLQSTKRLAGMLAEKGIRHELDLWGYDVPHDWQSWRAQIAHHLPRFC